MVWFNLKKKNKLSKGSGAGCSGAGSSAQLWPDAGGGHSRSVWVCLAGWGGGAKLGKYHDDNL